LAIEVDSEHLEVVLKRSGSLPPGKLDMAAGQLIQTCVLVGVSLPFREPDRSGGAAEVTELAAVAASYGTDADQRQSLTIKFGRLAAVALLGATGLLIAGLVRVGSGDDFSAPIFWVHLVAAVLLILFGIMALYVADRARRSSDESKRLQRQYEGLAPYLAPLPDATQALLRASLAGRLFPRLIDDTDPLRDPVLPDPVLIVQTVDSKDIDRSACRPISSRLRELVFQIRGSGH
jgi:hypothetical protein